MSFITYFQQKLSVLHRWLHYRIALASIKGVLAKQGYASCIDSIKLIQMKSKKGAFRGVFYFATQQDGGVYLKYYNKQNLAFRESKITSIIYQCLGAGQIQTPEISFTWPNGFAAKEFLGRPYRDALEKQLKLHPATFEQDFHALGHWLHRFHSVKAPLLEDAASHPLNHELGHFENNLFANVKKLLQVKVVDKTLLGQFTDFYQEFSATSWQTEAGNRVIVHGDFSYHQILYAGDQPKRQLLVLDFEATRQGYPVFELANFMAKLRHLLDLHMMTGLCLGLEQSFLQGYFNDNPLNNTKLLYTIEVLIFALRLRNKSFNVTAAQYKHLLKYQNQ